MKTDAKVLVCYNSPYSLFSIYNGKPVEDNLPQNDLSESSFAKEMKNVRKLLLNYYSEVAVLPVDRVIEKNINKILSISPDIIINFVESIEGVASLEAYMTGVYELLGIEYTGNVPSCLGNCLNKKRTKSILKSFNINTPEAITVEPGNKIREKEIGLNYPLILKLANEDASIGISEFSVVEDFKSLNKQLKFLFENYNQAVIIEEYISGRELNVAILGRNILPISEINFDGLPEELPKIVTYDGKWIESSIYYEHTKPVCPAELSSKTKKKIEEISLSAFDAMNCRDYARVDIRLDKNEVPFVVEVNPNPDVSTDSGFARAAAAAGITYPELLVTIANFALDRKKNDSQNKAI